MDVRFGFLAGSETAVVRVESLEDFEPVDGLGDLPTIRRAKLRSGDMDRDIVLAELGARLFDRLLFAPCCERLGPPLTALGGVR